MIKLIFKKDWHLINYETFINEVKQNFINVSALPDKYIYMALQKQGIATLQILENRTNSTAYRIWQTDVVFLYSTNLPHFQIFSNSLAYFEAEKNDTLIKKYFKKLPVFVGQRLTKTTALIKHCHIPKFNCIYKNGLIIETSFNSEGKYNIIYPNSSLIIKADAFYRSYFKPL